MTSTVKRTLTEGEFIDVISVMHPKLKIKGRYINKKTKILAHDEFGELLCTPKSLLKGYAPTIKSAVNKTEYFISKAKTLRANSNYDYSMVEYTGANSKIKLKCNECGNVFYQLANAHLRGCECILCANKRNGVKARKTNTKFIKEAVLIHGDKYDYSNTNYVESHVKVDIKCNRCGRVFEVTPASHIYRSTGCSKCSRITTDIFIKRCVAAHGDKYDYSEVEYINAESNVKIYCNKCKEYFYQPARSHSRGNGHIKCSVRRGWSRSDYVNMANDRLCTLYKIHCWNENESFYKIGITVNTINDRFSGSNMPYNYRVISEQVGDSGYIYDLENKEHRKHKKFKYNPSIYFEGETECFTKLL